MTRSKLEAEMRGKVASVLVDQESGRGLRYSSHGCMKVRVKAE